MINLNGGTGDDLFYLNTNTSLMIDLTEGSFSARNQTVNFESIESVSGNDRDDIIKGTDGDNILSGGGGADVLGHVDKA